MRINKKYKLFTTEVVEYKDEDGNEIHTEDGVITYVNVRDNILEFTSTGLLINNNTEKVD